MPKHLPVIKPKEWITALEKDGWSIHLQKGSHIIMHKPESVHLVVIPVHVKDLPNGTLHGILSDAAISVEKLIELLKQ